ncbi:MAG: hypothetical protein AAGF74_07295 [Pseudomonadota bacterium]
MRLPASLGAALLVAGCMDTAGGVSRDAAGTATGSGGAFGAPVSQARCQELASAHISATLRNPSSAGYSFGACTARTDPGAFWDGVGPQKGYGIDVSVRATNGWGVYTDPIAYRFLIRDDQVVRRFREDPRSGRMSVF